jgi:hypothetical protein
MDRAFIIDMIACNCARLFNKYISEPYKLSIRMEELENAKQLSQILIIRQGRMSMVQREKGAPIAKN